MAIRTRAARALMFFSALMIFAPMTGAARADTGAVHVVIDKAGFIVGVGGGRGVLTFKGRRYPLTIGGVSIGATIGASRSEFVGKALNMHSPTDIAGSYSAIGAGAALAGGAGAIRLQNAKGVVLELTGRKVGLEVSAALSGLNVSLR
jgi:hypothetical protein